MHFCYFVLWPAKAQLQLIYKLLHSYMFRHYRVIFRELVISILPSYLSMRGSQKVAGIPLQTENERWDRARSDVRGSLACLVPVATGVDRFRLAVSLSVPFYSKLDVNVSHSARCRSLNRVRKSSSYAVWENLLRDSIGRAENLRWYCSERQVHVQFGKIFLETLSAVQQI